MAEPKAGELQLLGECIRHARQRAGLGQKPLADQVREKIPPDSVQVVQSYIARLETGRVLPPREVLDALSDILKIPYGALIAAILRDLFARPGREELAYPYEKGLVTLSDLAEWEQRKSHSELWLVAERYVDDHFREFGDAVYNIVQRGGTVVFFAPKELDEAISAYRGEINDRAKRQTLPVQGKLEYAPLSAGERAMIAAPFVIANPLGDDGALAGERFPNGYLILNDAAGEPRLAITMSYQECRHRVGWLKTVLLKARSRSNES